MIGLFKDQEAARERFREKHEKKPQSYLFVCPECEDKNSYHDRKRIREIRETPMRPAINITHGLHGRLKDYAEANELELSEAYTEVLEAGLKALETQDQQ